jgi:hypothetical protein
MFAVGDDAFKVGAVDRRQFCRGELPLQFWVLFLSNAAV